MCAGMKGGLVLGVQKNMSTLRLQSFCMVVYFTTSPRRKQAVTYLLLHPKAKVFITEMECVVF